MKKKGLIKLLLLLIYIAFPFRIFCQEGNNGNRLKYYGQDHFLLVGTVIPDSLKERPFDRLPLHIKNKVHPHVWYLSRTSAGLALHFQTNSSTLGVKWEVLRDEKMNHMAETGIKGLDLYCKVGDQWRYINTAKPKAKKNQSLLFNDSSDSLREFMLYLPLYDGIKTLEVGLDSMAFLKKPDKDWSMKPIVFYGTSITQGGCASRPGMAYTNIISRKLNTECINLGFSGNGKMEIGVAEAMAEMDASLYVVDCIGNMTIEQIHQNVGPLVKTIRKKRPHTPIVFIENMMFERAFFNDSLRNVIMEKNYALKAEYVALDNHAENNYYYLGMRNASGNDHEGTVDGIHLTDLGFLRFSEYMIAELRKMGLVSEK